MLNANARFIRTLRNARGTAMIEAIPILVVFIVLVAAGLGVFGIVHTAVLNSIGARAYSFETYRQRTNLYYFREDGSGLQASSSINFTKKGWRYQAIQNETDSRNRFVATARPVYFGRALASSDASEETHNAGILQKVQDGKRNTDISVNPAWVMVGYGICLNATCGN